MLIEGSQQTITQALFDLARATGDEAVFAYANLFAAVRYNGRKAGNYYSEDGQLEAGEILMQLIRTLAESRRYLLEREVKRLQSSINPPVIVIDKEAVKNLDSMMKAGSIVAFSSNSYMTRGAMLDRTPLRELFQSLKRRLTRCLKAWYKGLP